VKLGDALPSLRRKQAYACFRKAVLKARARGFAINQFAVLSNHIHFIIEAENRPALSRQMQAFGISLAKRLNAVLERKGAVLLDRYHVHILKTPAEVKNALRYVLANSYRHQGGKGRIELDSYSSAIGVADRVWAGLFGRTWGRIVGFPEEDPPEMERIRAGIAELVSAPRTWLLSHGWARA
jgi:hypothetical protein